MEGESGEEKFLPPSANMEKWEGSGGVAGLLPLINTGRRGGRKKDLIKGGAWKMKE